MRRSSEPGESTAYDADGCPRCDERGGYGDGGQEEEQRSVAAEGHGQGSAGERREGCCCVGGRGEEP